MPRPTTLPTGFDIPIDKLTKFLLDRQGSKPERADFFLRHGFDPNRPDELAAALYEHATIANHVGFAQHAYGYSIIYEGPLIAPVGLVRDIRSIWQVDDADRSGRARFVTAYRYR